MQRKLSTGMAATSDGFAMAGPPRSMSRGPHAVKGQWWSWYEPGTSKAEKWLIFKLDCFILWYTCLSFFVKYLDQTSVTNAFVTGMQEDLKLAANDLNWLTTYYNIGIIIGAPFFTFGLTIVPPRWWLPGSTLVMSLFVLFMFEAKNASTLYALRFCAGLFASGIQSGSYYIIGSWYRKSEISRRAGIFTVASIAGGMLSGPIQSGLAGSVNGHGSIAAWQWLFVLDAIITFPVAIFGFIFCPDEPRAPKMWWMSANEHAISIERLQSEGRDSNAVLDWSIFRRILGSWQFYVFPLAYMFREFTCGTEMIRWMTLYLKSKRYPASQFNTIPVSVGCSEIIAILAAGILVDKTQNPALIIVIFGLIQVYGYSVFVDFPRADNSWLISTYIITGSAYQTIGPIVNSWLNMECKGDKYLRAAATATITVLGYTAETVGQQIFFPVSDAPAFKPTRGYVWGLCWNIVYVIWAGALIPATIGYFRRRDLQERLAENEDSSAGKSNGHPEASRDVHL